MRSCVASEPSRSARPRARRGAAAAQRSAYALHVRALLTDDAEQLVITLDYDDEIATGPPFPVGDDELLAYWPHLDCVEQRDDIANAPPKFLDAGLTELREKVWRSS